MSVVNFIDNYLSQYRQYKENWNYEDGCVYKGVLDLYWATKEDKYLQFIIKQLDNFISSDGNINNYQIEEFNIDNINAGKVLFDIYEITGDKKYKKAIELLKQQLVRHPRTQENNFWHKRIYPNQVWLDGLYMAMPFYARYEKVFNQAGGYMDICTQFMNVRKRMWDHKKQLYYHGYDESKKELWSNPETGLSQNFWGRAMGWFVMAMVDTIEFMEKDPNHCDELKTMFVEAIEGLLKYQEQETGMWYQVIDEGCREGNYLETSATLMIAYSILKGVRLGLLPQGYKENGIKAFEGTINKYLDAEANQLGGICGVAGLGNLPYRDGSYEYYISERIAANDPKGVGTLLMTYSEYLL